MNLIFALLLIFGVILFILKKVSRTNQTVKKHKTKNPGMYFMELYEETEQIRKSSIENIDNPHYIHLSNWYLILAYACQGRICDIDDMYDYYKDEFCEFNETYIRLLQSEKKQIYAMARIAKRIDDSDMSDMKDNESIGEYTDRKLQKNKAFMEKYNYYLNYNFII
ncbi:hypothetical protein D0T84_21275 [Dysgonomonas sp. 521]|uniref:hypothetical protein n=1 Tax=Dysgonomonas sp. 521 TaxID=2302932 RepID=UPI0013D430CB|nr:hypothetical protein [Dysgonomonas sp. 521]NDV97408.1 hypothetical protein [Dysgonomonas sp. 521]